MAQKPFAKDEMLSMDGEKTVRVENGPWKNIYGKAYLVEQADGNYVFTNANRLTRQPPKAGDQGQIAARKTSDKPHPYSPHTWVYMDADVVLLKDRLGDYDVFTGPDRQRVIDTWEAI